MKAITLEVDMLYFIAHCHACDIKMPFRSPLDREEWVTQHAAAHGVLP